MAFNYCKSQREADELKKEGNKAEMLSVIIRKMFSQTVQHVGCERRLLHRRRLRHPSLASLTGEMSFHFIKFLSPP